MSKFFFKIRSERSCDAVFSGHGSTIVDQSKNQLTLVQHGNRPSGPKGILFETMLRMVFYPSNR